MSLATLPTDDSGDGLLALVSQTLNENKAEDLVCIDLRGKSPLADYMVIASGRSQRHTGALGDAVLRSLKKAKQKQIRSEGMTQCDWVLLDAGDIIIHIFRPEVRRFYNLEKIWLSDMAVQEA